MAENQVSAALKMIPYGFYAIGSHYDGDDNLMVLNWLTQASFEPQLIALGLQKSAYSYALIEKSGKLVVNILRAEDQEAIAGLTKSRDKNPDKMKDAAYSAGPTSGAPVLDAAAAFLECEVVDTLETGGDHNIVLAKVVNAEVRKPGEAGETLNLPDMGWSYAG